MATMETMRHKPNVLFVALDSVQREYPLKTDSRNITINQDNKVPLKEFLKYSLEFDTPKFLPVEQSAIRMGMRKRIKVVDGICGPFELSKQETDVCVRLCDMATCLHSQLDEWLSFEVNYVVDPADGDR